MFPICSCGVVILVVASATDATIAINNDKFY